MHYDETRLRKIQFPHPIMVHWLLNPGLVINELLLGQRVPRLMLVERGVFSLLSTQYWVPCPSCKEVHDGRLWTGQHAFGHWSGCVCPSCGEKIPSLLNFTSLICLMVLYPVIFFARRRWGKPCLLAELERTRAASLTLRKKSDGRKSFEPNERR